MSFVLWFSKRLKLGGEARQSAATGTVIAVAGVALAIMVMELSIAVASGFKHEIERKLMGFDSPVTVLPPYDYNAGRPAAEMSRDEELLSFLTRKLPEGTAVEMSKQAGVLKTDSDFLAVECRAYGAGHSREFEKGNSVVGQYVPGTDSIIVSLTIANQLGLSLGDRPFIYFYVDGKPKARRVTVGGIYNSNFSDYDNVVVYAPMSLLQSLGTDTTAISAIAIEGVGDDIGRIVDISGRLQSDILDGYRTGELSGVYPVSNIVEQGAVFFSWLGLIDTNVVVIIILMTFVAAFTLISSLFIIVLDRVPTIGTMRAMGASRRLISRVFVSITMRIVGLGLLIGNALALGIIFLQKSTHILPLNPEMYYLDSVPFDITWVQVAVLNIGAVVVAWLLLIVPARVAAGIDPASTMRYD